MIQTTPELASSILEMKHRKITLDNGYLVKWVNLNNNTCWAEKNESGSIFYNENVTFYIQVPVSAKTIY